MIEHVIRRAVEHGVNTWGMTHDGSNKRVITFEHTTGINTWGMTKDGSNKIFKRIDDTPLLIFADMPVWGAFAICLTFIASMVFVVMVEYALNLIAAMAMVETPAAAITVSTPDEPASKDEKETLLESGPTITLVHTKPITSSIRGSLKHLKALPGRFTRVRGFGIHLLHALVFSLASGTIAMMLPLPFFFSRIVGAALGGAVCAPLHAAWTNKVISTPTSMPLMQRIPGSSAYKVLALPAAVSMSMPYVSVYIAKGVICLLGLHHATPAAISNYTGAEIAFFVLRWVVVAIVAISCGLFLCLPAVVTKVRIEACLLSEDQDAVVPFDRTFEGKVVPQVLGGSGAIGFVDAWKSFDWEARRRLLKHYVKQFFIEMGMLIVVAHVMVAVVFAVMGSVIFAKAKQEGVMT